MEALMQFIKAYWMILLPAAVAAVAGLIALARKGVLKKVNLGGFELEFQPGSTKKRTSLEMFSRSDSTEFAQRFESLARQASRIVLIGTGINILHRDPLLLELLERVANGKCTLEVYLGNPFSRQIEARLIEEEMGNIKPPVGKQGLIQRLETILEKQRELGNPDALKIALFSNYPTLAMFILDAEYFIYPYGYAKLGNLSPLMQFSRNDPCDRPMIDFMEEQYQRIKASSTDARLVMDVYHRRKVPLETLTASAVYLIPPAESALYQFGARVLGYDIYENRQILSPFAAYVGDAADFGFHVTVADVLYLYQGRDLELLKKEVEFVAQGMPSMRLEFELVEGFPTRDSTALVCRERQGVLEALHHEMVARFYRGAAGSNYDLGAHPQNRNDDPERSKWMITRYHAPYILQQYKPHFTLLTKLPEAAEERRKVMDELRRNFEAEVAERQIELKSLFVLKRPAPKRAWQIAREVPFG